MATANGTHAETSLFDRKLKIAEGLSCRQLFTDLEAIDGQIDQQARDRIDLDQRLAAARAQVDDAETMVSLTVEGKNDSERKARKAQLLRDDPAYRAAAAAVAAVEHERAEADVTAESLRRQARRIERTIDYRCAALRLMGG